MNAPALRRWWPRLQLLAGVAVLVVLAARVGAGALLDAVRAVDALSVLAALLIGLLTTVLGAARWRLVARGLGVSLPLGRAVADTYRAQFLNSVLPAGVLGDVDRAVCHGLRDGGRAARAVVLERVAGQTVVVAVGVAGLAVAASGLPAVPAAAGALAVLGLLMHKARRPSPAPAPVDAAVDVAVELAVHAAADVAPSRLRSVLAEVRAGLSGRAGPVVVLLSAAGLAGHLALFVVAARAAGATAPLGVLLPLLLASLLAMVLPVNVGGWGPREAVAAVGFGAAGFGAALGLTVAVVFGVLGLVSCLPGALVLLVRRSRPAAPDTARTPDPVREVERVAPVAVRSPVPEVVPC